LEKECLFCEAIAPSSVEHIIPESLGNDDFILIDEICFSCNNHFAKIEEFVLQKTDIAIWRALLGIRSKKGKLPSVDLSQPKKSKGVYPNHHPHHPNGVRFTAQEDGSCLLESTDDRIKSNLIYENTFDIKFVMTPYLLHQFGRFLCKIGIEAICFVDPTRARTSNFQAARVYARHGTMTDLWPIFHFSSGNIETLVRSKEDGTENVDCYEYSLLEIDEQYTLFRLKVGTNNWVVCLNEKWPTPELKTAFPESVLQLIWYPRESYE
jgi:HNH endonuclease